MVDSDREVVVNQREGERRWLVTITTDQNTSVGLYIRIQTLDDIVPTQTDLTHQITGGNGGGDDRTIIHFKVQTTGQDLERTLGLRVCR